jgi:hypothetical protein
VVAKDNKEVNEKGGCKGVDQVDEKEVHAKTGCYSDAGGRLCIP